MQAELVVCNLYVAGTWWPFARGRSLLPGSKLVNFCVVFNYSSVGKRTWGCKVGKCPLPAVPPPRTDVRKDVFDFVPNRDWPGVKGQRSRSLRHPGVMQLKAQWVSMRHTIFFLIFFLFFFNFFMYFFFNMECIVCGIFGNGHPLSDFNWHIWRNMVMPFRFRINKLAGCSLFSLYIAWN